MNDEIETTIWWADGERILTVTSNKGPLMYFPSTADYVEIMGHKIDFEGGYKEFVEYLHKLETYEEENKKLKASVKYYVDILTDLKKWLELHKVRPTALSTIYAQIEYNFYEGVLNKIKELEEKNNAK